VSQVLGPVTYRLDLGGTRQRVANVNTMKEFIEQEKALRVTKVLEDDSEQDELNDTHWKLKVLSKPLSNDKNRDIQNWCEEFDDILSEEPGLTGIVKFNTDTGENETIAQHPYNSPVTLRVGVNYEIDWLLKN